MPRESFLAARELAVINKRPFCFQYVVTAAISPFGTLAVRELTEGPYQSGYAVGGLDNTSHYYC